MLPVDQLEKFYGKTGFEDRKIALKSGYRIDFWHLLAGVQIACRQNVAQP
ncbi:hypothetical protein ACQZ6Z_16885 [Agrobacterium vitis]